VKAWGTNVTVSLLTDPGLQTSTSYLSHVTMSPKDTMICTAQSAYLTPTVFVNLVPTIPKLTKVHWRALFFECKQNITVGPYLYIPKSKGADAVCLMACIISVSQSLSIKKYFLGQTFASCLFRYMSTRAYWAALVARYAFDVIYIMCS